MKNSKIMKIKQIGVLLMALTLLCSGCKKDEPKESAKAQLQKFDILLDWQAEPTYIGVYYAKELGLFTKLGLDVNIVQSWGANAAVAAVASGKYKIATASGGATVLGYNATTNLVSLGVLYPRIPTVVYGLAAANLRSPESLKGKKIGVYPSSVTVNEFYDFLKVNNIRTNELTIISISGADIPLLQSSQVDAVLHYHEMSPVQVETTPNFPGTEGHRTSELMLADFGVKGYGLNVVTSRTALTQEKELMVKIADAIFEGYRLSCEHPEEATKVFLKMFPDKNEAYVKASFERVIKLVGKNYGQQTSEGWAETIKVYSDLGLLPKTLDAKSLLP